MRRIAMVGVIAVAALALVLAGCGKKEQTNAQSVVAPGPTHTMPDGKQMAGAEHGAPAGKANMPAAEKAGAAAEMASCPVLGTTMAKDKMIPYEREGKTYYFCCQSCVEKFKKNPDKYINNPATPKPAGQGMEM